MKSQIEKNKDIQQNFQLIIIDFMNVFYRYKYSMRDLKDSKGNETGVYYGVINFIYYLKKRYKKVKIIFVNDRNSTVKKLIDKSYKANRESKFKENKKKILELQNLLSLYNIYQYYTNGYEADDLAAKIVKENKDKKILLVSTDNDWWQLLSDNVKLFRDNEIWDKKMIEEKYEVDISKQLLIKSIIGEKKENVKGIKNFPRKLLKELCSNFSSLEKIYIYCELYSKVNKWCKKILENIDLLKINYKLKSLIDKGYKLQEIKRQNDKKKLLKVLKKYEMNNLWEKIKNENN